MQFDNQKTKNVADAVAKILAGETVSEELKGQQHKIDVNKNNKIDAEDFKHLRAGKKPADVKKEEVENIDEVSGFIKGVKRVMAGKKNPSDVRDAHLAKSTFSSDPKVKEREGRRYDKVQSVLSKEEVENIGEASTYKLGRAAAETKNFPIHHNGEHVGTLEFHTSAGKLHHRVASVKGVPHEKFIGHPDREKMTNAHVAKHEAAAREHFAKKIKEEVEQIQEYESKGGVYKHKGTYGSAKGAEYGETDYDKENEMAKNLSKPVKPARKKYGARQNYVRSSRVNESFSGLLGVYREQGLKGLSEALVKEEPTNDEYKAELDDHRAKAEGKKKQPELHKGSVQAVKSEETEIAVINADKANGVQIETIDEREMTPAEMKDREKIVKGMKKGLEGFKERYGERAKSVMYATATKQAMK